MKDGKIYLNGKNTSKTTMQEFFYIDATERNEKVKKATFTLCRPSGEEISILENAYNINMTSAIEDMDEIDLMIPYFIKRGPERHKNPNWDLVQDEYLIMYDNEKMFVINSIRETGDGVKHTKHVQGISLEYRLSKRKLSYFKGTRQLYRGEEDGKLLRVDYSFDGEKWKEDFSGKPFIMDRDKKLYIRVLDSDGKTLNTLQWNTQDSDITIPGLKIQFETVDHLENSITMKLELVAESGDGILNELERETGWRVGFIEDSVRYSQIEGQNHRKYRTFNINNKAWIQVIKEDICGAFKCVPVFDGINKKINFYDKDTFGKDRDLYISKENYLKNIKKHMKDDDIVTRLKIFGKNNVSISSVNPTGMNYIENYEYFKKEKYMSQELINSLNDYEKKLDIRSDDFKNILEELERLRKEKLVLENELVDLKREYTIAQDDIDLAIQRTKKSIDQVSDINEKTDLSRLNLVRDEIEEKMDLKNNEIEEKSDKIASKLTEKDNLKNDLSKENNFSQNQLKILDGFVKEQTWSNTSYSHLEELMEEGVYLLEEMAKPSIEFSIDVADFFNLLECPRNFRELSIGDCITIFYPELNIDTKIRIVAIKHNIDKNGLQLVISNKNHENKPGKYISSLMNSAHKASSAIDMFGHKWELAEKNTDKVSEIINSALDTAKNRVLSGRNQNISISERGISLKDMDNGEEQLRMLNNVIAFTQDGWKSCSLAISPEGVVAESLFGKVVATNKLLITNLNDEGESTFSVDQNHMRAYNMDLSLENDYNRIFLDPDQGIKIQKKSADTWKDTLWLDTEGTLNCKDIVASNLEIRNHKDDVILNSESGYLNLGKLRMITDDGKITPIEKKYLKKEWNRIQIEYPKLMIQAGIYNTSSRDELELVSTEKLSETFAELETSLTNILNDMETPSTVVQGHIERKFEGYYGAAREVQNKIEDSIKYSSLQLGKSYNNTLIDAVNGITVSRVEGDTGKEISKTVLNATTGISISTKKDGVWEDNFWVDPKGNLTAKNLLILDENDRVAFKADENGDLDLEGRLKVIRYQDHKKTTLLDVYKDEDYGGKIEINNWLGEKNVFLGSAPDEDYNGGFLKMFNNSGDRRIEFGTYTGEDAGRLKLFGKDNNVNVAISAIDDEGRSSGVIKLYDDDNNPCMFISAKSDKNVVKRNNTQLVIGQEIEHEIRPKVGLYGGKEDFGGFIELGDKKGVPNLSLGDISRSGNLLGAHSVWYANMEEDNSEQRREKRRVQIGIYGDENRDHGEINFFDYSGVNKGVVSGENDELVIKSANGQGASKVLLGKEGELILKTYSMSRSQENSEESFEDTKGTIVIKNDGTIEIKSLKGNDINIDAGSGNVNIKGSKINLG